MKKLLLFLLFLLFLPLFIAGPVLAVEWKATHVETNATFTFTFPYEVEGLEGFRFYQDGELIATIPPDTDRVEQRISFVYGRTTQFTMIAFTADEEGLPSAPFVLRPPIPPSQGFNVTVDFGIQ